MPVTCQLRKRAPEERRGDIQRRKEGEASPLRVRRVKGGEGCNLERISPRQRDVLRLIAQGKGTNEIAAELYISPETVKTHRRRLQCQLGPDVLIGCVAYLSLDPAIRSEIERIVA